LTAAPVTLAQTVGMPAVYLLTTSAESYFPKFGFVHVTRAQVPASVKQSIEFRSACPASAIVMRKALNARAEE
jgi:amino-acid N-acetyltransferase